MKYITIFVVIVFLTACNNKKAEKTGLEGKPLPEFSLLLSDSSTKLNTKDIPYGKPIVLFIFTPNCPYCRAQTKNMLSNMDKLSAVQLLMVTNAPFFAMKKYFDEYQLNKYPTIAVGIDSGNVVSDYFEVTGFPFTAIYTKDKNLNKAFMGKIYSKQIIEASQE